MCFPVRSGKSSNDLRLYTLNCSKSNRIEATIEEEYEEDYRSEYIIRNGREEKCTFFSVVSQHVVHYFMNCVLWFKMIAQPIFHFVSVFFFFFFFLFLCLFAFLCVFISIPNKNMCIPFIKFISFLNCEWTREKKRMKKKTMQCWRAKWIERQRTVGHMSKKLCNWRCVIYN